MGRHDRSARNGRPRRAAGGASRREVVAALGAAAAALAGCSTLGESSSFREFERRLRERSVDVKRISEDFRRWTVEYYPDASSQSAFEAEVATVASVYAETVPAESENANHRFLECILFDDRKTRTGSYEVRAAWARERAAGTITESAYLEKIRSTVER